MNKTESNNVTARAGAIKAFLLIGLLAGLMVMIGIIGNTILDKFLDFEDISLAWAAFFVSALFIEEMTKYLFLRNFRFWSALGVILIAAMIESLLYAFFAEIVMFPYSLLTVWGVWFWYTMLVRFIYNGHLIFFLWSAGTTKVFNRYIPFLKRTGRTINVAGWLVGGSIHYLWNVSLTYPELTKWFGSLAIVLAIGSVSFMWGLGEFKRFLAK